MDREQLHQDYRSAVELAGGASAYGRIVGVSKQAVSQALDRGAIMPAEHVLKVCRALSLTPSRLRPDLYPEGSVL